MNFYCKPNVLLIVVTLLWWPSINPRDLKLGHVLPTSFRSDVVFWSRRRCPAGSCSGAREQGRGAARTPPPPRARRRRRGTPSCLDTSPPSHKHHAADTSRGRTVQSRQHDWPGRTALSPPTRRRPASSQQPITGRHVTRRAMAAVSVSSYVILICLNSLSLRSAAPRSLCIVGR